MKKMFFSNATMILLLLCSHTAVYADNNISYDSNNSVGFVGEYTPPSIEKESPTETKDDVPEVASEINKEDSVKMTLNNSEKRYLAGGTIPNAGDNFNFVYIFIAAFLALGTLFFTSKLKEREKNNSAH